MQIDSNGKDKNINCEVQWKYRHCHFITIATVAKVALRPGFVILIVEPFDAVLVFQDFLYNYTKSALC